MTLLVDFGEDLLELLADGLATDDAVDLVALVSLDVLICDDQGRVEVQLVGLDQSRVVLLGQLAEESPDSSQAGP